MKNSDRGLENVAVEGSIFKTEVTVFRYTDRPKPVNNFFSLSLSLSQTTLFTHGKKTHASVTVTVVRDRKIRTALRTNQIAEFVTVTAWKKTNEFYFRVERAQRVSEILFLPRENKIHIFKPPCNVLFIIWTC